MRNRTPQLLCALLAGTAVVLLGVIGCGPNAGDMVRAQQSLAAQATTSPLPAETSGLVRELTQLMKDQGVLDKWLAHCRAHGINPGLKIEQSITHSTKIGLDGFDAQIELQADGTGTQLPTGVREQLIDVLKQVADRTDPESLALRKAILEMLAWNREESPHNPVPR